MGTKDETKGTMGGTIENNENKGWNNGWNNRTIGGTLQNNGWHNENKARKYIKNLYDDILNTMFTLFNSEFCTFRDTIWFLRKISSNDFVFTKNFEQRFCFYKKFRATILFFTKNFEKKLYM